MKRGEKMSAKQKARISASQKRSYASGTRRRIRTKQQITIDRLDETYRLMEERERKAEYLARAELQRAQYAAMDEQERQRKADELWNDAHGLRLPKGVRRVGSGRVIPVRECSDRGCTCHVTVRTLTRTPRIEFV
jgi:hypothetical protein